MIYGLTHDIDGEPYKRVIISRKLAVGLAPLAAGTNHPKRLESFIVCERSKDPKMKGVFVEDVPFTKMLIDKQGGGPLMEVDIILLDNDPEVVLKTQYAFRSQNRANAMLCFGDGRDAMRRFEIFTDREKEEISSKHEPKDFVPIEGWCGGQCPYLQAKKCKPSADIYFMFPEDPVRGNVCTLHTGGWEATKRLASSLNEIRATIEEYGGSLRGLQLKLVARPYRAPYKDKQGNDDSSTQLAFNLEFRSNDHRKLLPQLIEASRQMPEDLPVIDHVEGLSDEEIADEFHPTPEQTAAQEREEEQQQQRQPSGRSPALDRVVQQAKPATAAKTKLSDEDNI